MPYKENRRRFRVLVDIRDDCRKFEILICCISMHIYRQVYLSKSIYKKVMNRNSERFIMLSSH